MGSQHDDLRPFPHLHWNCSCGVSNHISREKCLGCGGNRPDSEHIDLTNDRRKPEKLSRKRRLLKISNKS